MLVAEKALPRCMVVVPSGGGDLPLWGILQWSCCWARTPATAEASLEEVSGVEADQK